jgi:maleate isomerase
MTDSAGLPQKFAIIAPSPIPRCGRNSTPCARAGSNHFGRIYIPNDPIRDDGEFNQLMDNIRKEMMRAVDDVMTCEPDYLIMGMSSETF